jgi:DNA gyrase subunit B
VSFLQEARLLEEQVRDIAGLQQLISRNGDDRAAHKVELLDENDEYVIVRTIELKTGLATTHHVRRAALDAHEYHRLSEVHAELVALVGTPPYSIQLGESKRDAITFEELREGVLAVAQRGIEYYRFKGLGEMDAEELRETTMDPSSRTLVQVTMEDAASADLVFSMLMGDQVEPRRAFIEEHALAANIDV